MAAAAFGELGCEPDRRLIIGRIEVLIAE